MSTTTRPIALPTLHTNGTSSRMLLDGYIEASLAIQSAVEALSKVEFNGRDYYPQGDGAWKQAVEEHAARFEALHLVRADLDAITEHIMDTKWNL